MESLGEKGGRRVMTNLLLSNNVTLADLQDLRERVTKYRNNKSSICITIDTSFYDHNQHIEERIIIWDSTETRHFYFTSLREAQAFVEKLEKGGN